MEPGKTAFVPDLLVRADKKTILESIECFETSPAYGEMSSIYDRQIVLAKTLIAPKAAFVAADKPADLDVYELQGCRQILFCLLTIGQSISDQSTDFFESGLYAEGLLLDAIANYALFDCSRQLYQKVACEAYASGLGLTRRLSPGDGELDVCCQRTILQQFDSDILSISLTSGHMLNPVKSLAYVYGISSALPLTDQDHDCSKCTRTECHLRHLPAAPPTIRLTVNAGQMRRVIETTPHQTIMDALALHSIRVHSPCGGQGKCGKCKIKVLSGYVSGEAGADLYLACRTYPLSDCEIDLMLSTETSYQTATNFAFSSETPNSGFQVISQTIMAADWKSGDSMASLIQQKLASRKVSLQAMRKLAIAQQQARGKEINLAVIVRDKTIVDIRNEKGPLLGVAIDVGTTTVVLDLVDLETGEILKTRSLLNSQRSYGADVISRIQYGAGKNKEVLRTSICRDLFDGIQAFGENVAKDIVHIAIVGNTTMLHFLLGLPAESMGSYPFLPVTTSLQELTFAEVFTDLSLDCIVSVLPGVSAFVGADIVAGMLQCEFYKTEKISILLDIGTNGEIAIGNKDRIICLSTAAGPAFEGANISCGTGSVSGAIASLCMSDGQFLYTTIDSGEPCGICGSGVMDIMAVCVTEGLVDATGRFDTKRVPGGILPIAKTNQDTWLEFTQKDVRELQLAKSAMRSGIDVLVKTYGCNYQDIDTVYLAGSFGLHLNVNSAVAIGLLPKPLQSKVKTVGNSALGGAVQYLLESASTQHISRMLAVTTHLDLASDKTFNELFIENMLFPE